FFFGRSSSSNAGMPRLRGGNLARAAPVVTCGGANYEQRSDRGSPAMSLPAAMTVIGIRAPGGPETLVPELRPVPQPGSGQILGKAAAAGVTRPDVLQRLGLYPPPKGASDIPGLEIAGIVVACGDGVTRWKAGDQVTALVVGGGYAEYCLAVADHALPIPAGISAVEAAAMPETFF